MNPTIKLDGLDVSAASIAVAVTDSGQARPRYQGAISNPPEAVTQPEALSLSLDSDHRSKPQPHPTEELAGSLSNPTTTATWGSGTVPSHFAWIDFSDTERQRMIDVIRLFRQQDTRDELGIGSIRDGFANHFFPGTSTIQTRAKYMLFVPWIYQALEKRRVPSHRIQAVARRAELRLIDALRKADDTTGVIGIEAGDRLQRLPSAIYWAGLGIWGIRLFPGSQDQYHRSLDGWYARRRNRARDDDGQPIGPEMGENWHPGLPDTPEGWPEEVDLRLTPDEAGYLHERVVGLHRDSLLGFLVDADEYVYADCLWSHPIAGSLPERLREEIIQARSFAETIHGAALLYNLMLSEACADEELIDHYRSALADWSHRMRSLWNELIQWYADLASFWASLPLRVARIPRSTEVFVSEWCRRVFTGPSPDAVVENSVARDMITRRELWLKRTRARLVNPSALKAWGGASGSAKLDYRWYNASTLIEDILDGLHGSPHSPQSEVQ